MRNAIADVSTSRNKGFSLVEVAVAIALLSIATAFSFPPLNRLAGHQRFSLAAAPSATHSTALSTFTPRLVSGVEPPSVAPKVKLMDLIRGYPASGIGRELINWSALAPAAEPNFLAIAKAEAPSGGQCSPRAYATQSAKSAPAGANFNTNGC